MPTTREMELPSLRLRPGSRKAFALRGPGESGPRDGQRRYGYRLPNRGGMGGGIVRTGVQGGKTPGDRMELAGGKLPGALDGALWAGKPPELLP